MQKIKINLKITVFFIFSLILLISCYTYNQSTSGSRKNKNLAYLYNPNSQTIHPEYKIIHISDNESKLITRIYKDELYYIRSTVSEGYFADFKISCKVYNSYTNRMIADSISKVYNFRKSLLKDTFDLELPLKIKKDSLYYAKIKLKDLNRERVETYYVFIDKRNIFSKQNYEVIDVENNKILFDNIIKTNKKYTVNNYRLNKNDYFVSVFNQKFPPALLPFSTSQQKLNTIPDTTFFINDTLIAEQEGLYFLRTDTTINKGLFLGNFTKNYPDLKTPVELLEPLRYITSSSEYKRLKNSSSKKIAVDRFWLNLTGNAGRARELIKIYYNRVKLANKYFTSYKEGWKTDRGMIFVIFGAPTIVYKSDKYEKWIYGENQTNAGLIFLFEKKKIFFSATDFILHRNQVYKSTWYQAVDVWRNGRVFTVVY